MEAVAGPGAAEPGALAALDGVEPALRLDRAEEAKGQAMTAGAATVRMLDREPSGSH